MLLVIMTFFLFYLTKKYKKDCTIIFYSEAEVDFLTF